MSTRDGYDHAAHSMRNAKGYSMSGESEYSRERNLPYAFADKRIDEDLRHGRGFVGKGPKGYRRSDERIYEDICECLGQDPELDARNIEVSVLDGFVYLKGRVENRYFKRLAQRLIEDLPGVRDVENLITLG